MTGTGETAAALSAAALLVLADPHGVRNGPVLGQALRDARGDRPMTEVAAAVGMSPETLRKIESGRVPTPAFFTVAALAEDNWMFEPEDEPPRTQ